MKEEQKPDNLEKFFQRVLQDHEEDPGTAFWERIAPNIPPKSVGKPPFVYNGWMVVIAFLAGLIANAFLFNWQSNTLVIEQLEEALFFKKSEIIELKQSVIQLQNTIVINENKYKKEVNSLKETSEITQRLLTSKTENINALKILVQNLSAEKERLIKLGITRESSVVAATENNIGSMLQPFYVNGVNGNVLLVPIK